jgi:hypothetical protein
MALGEPAETPPFVCRFEKASSDGRIDPSYRDFCAFEFPGCAGCPIGFHAISSSVPPSEDPLKSIAWRNLQFPVPALHLQEACRGAAQRRGAKLLTEKQMKAPPPKMDSSATLIYIDQSPLWIERHKPT